MMGSCQASEGITRKITHVNVGKKAVVTDLVVNRVALSIMFLVISA